MDRSGGTTEGSRLERFLFGSEPAAFELLWGHDGYIEHVVAAARRFWLLFLPLVLVGIVLPGPDVAGFRPTWAAGLAVFSLLLVVLGARLARRATQNQLYRFISVLCPLAGVAVWLMGPSFAESAGLLPIFAVAFATFYTSRAAISLVVIAMTSYAVVLATVDGYPRPVARFLLVSGIVAASIAFIQFVVNQIRVLAESERAAHAQVATMNAELEARVAEQVDEIDRLGRLRRFLSPQVAETVMSTGGEALLDTHRRQIAVVFVDLRGFTSFSGVAEPEDVVDVLTEFYAAVGKIVKRLEATVGAFQGDGVMVYFNDPFPCEDPAGRALEMATSLRDPLMLLRDKWLARGFEIGFGIGIAYGYATLGTIGFEDRSDYTPLGSVVNLASRLCDEARHGEALLDARAYEAVQDRVMAAKADLDLKGFSGTVTAYRVGL